ncbi:hypothetical protein NliqN6_6769 [Naganishia liquefaciens]|uniref:SDR family NAD(P)-dependent oxidoreductase n=1 Tax=Naganishia liquefaciens TaxID=104408 RepID=A0A8H3U054_9TREE|nr:hypothetical protein NliqN6_6769 [Naganishia liquefaciens]
MAGIFSTSRLFNKTALITGASGGIGAATAILFARAGANVIISARRKEQLAKVAEQARQANKEGQTGQGGKVFELILDVSDRRSADNIFDKLPADFKKVDILVNNAGLVYGTDHVGDINEAEADTMFNTNVMGMIHLTQIFVRHFKQNNAGHVIQLGSVAGREGYAGGSIYCATKHALRGFTVALMKELVNTPIRVTEVQPGMVETSFSVTRFRGDEDKAKNVYKGIQPLVAEDIAEDIVWAASRKDHINVAEIFVMPVNQASPNIAYRAGQ